MKYGIDIPNFGHWADPRHVAEFAREIEEAGWDGLSIWDHLLLWPGTRSEIRGSLWQRRPLRRTE